LPVHKWNKSFSGAGGRLELLDFLEKVDIFSLVERTKHEILRSAFNLFKRNARDWYVTSRQKFDSYDTLVAQLKKTYVPGDYDFIVKTEIEKRHQSEHESFTKFLVDMKKKSNDLQYPWSEGKMCFLLKNRLNKYYAETKFLHQVQNMENLADLCRKLESHYETSRDVGKFNSDRTMHGRREGGMRFSVFVKVEKPLETSYDETEVATL
jgi:hypothetical protein